MKTIFVTGGAGFIGSALIRLLIAESDWRIVNIDKLTYAGNLESLADLSEPARHVFSRTDICDRAALDELFIDHQPAGVIHLAAESHVDRSIHGPGDFIETNIKGTYTLLEAARAYWITLEAEAKAGFRFHHVSTDEVFGSLGDSGLFVETSPYQPNSPYSASKAASDHLVRAWHHTYGLPTRDDQLLEQLRPLPVSRKADPADDPQRRLGQAAADLRQGRQRARLALRR